MLGCSAGRSENNHYSFRHDFEEFRAGPAERQHSIRLSGDRMARDRIADAPCLFAGHKPYYAISGDPASNETYAENIL